MHLKHFQTPDLLRSDNNSKELLGKDSHFQVLGEETETHKGIIIGPVPPNKSDRTESKICFIFSFLGLLPSFKKY